jgi:hypothetical protein
MSLLGGREVYLSLKPASSAYPLEMDSIEAYGVVKGDYP